jgi:hypothetical protein
MHLHCLQRNKPNCERCTVGKNSITQLTLVEIVLTITFSTGESIVGIFDRK